MRKVKSLLKETTPFQICSAQFLKSPEFHYGFRYAAHLKKLCMPHEKSSKYAWEPRNGDSGRIR